MFKAKVFLIQMAKKMWPKVTAFALFGVASAFLSFLLRHRLPDNLAFSVTPETVGTILNILASSMLAVTTFSLTVMVSAYSSATTSVTPRATQLVIQDHTAQNVLATFLGTFLYSLVGIIALNAEIYQDKGRVVLFATTLCVVIIMVISLIRWIDKLTTIGRVGETTRLVQAAAAKALQARAVAPCLGCNRLDFSEVAMHGMMEIRSCGYGYVQFIDTKDLAKVADKADCDIYVTAVPGSFVTPQTALVRVTSKVDEETIALIRKEFTIADERAFEQDPRYGICVLAEIAQRSLPTFTDLGTIIDVVGRLVTVLAEFGETKREIVTCKRIWLPPLSVPDLFSDAFDAIIRDAADSKQVQLRLHRSLRSLQQIDNDEFKECALYYSRLAIRHSDASPRLLESEKEELRRAGLGGEASRKDGV